MRDRSLLDNYGPRAFPWKRRYRCSSQGTNGDEIKPLRSDALAKSARTILVSLAPAAFSPLYGMLTDQYGVTWIVGADTAPAGG